MFLTLVKLTFLSFIYKEWKLEVSIITKTDRTRLEKYRLFNLYQFLPSQSQLIATMLDRWSGFRS